MRFEVPSAACTIQAEVIQAGSDCTIAIQGGVPHVGCIALAIPRPSLTGHGTSATVSTLNRTGHMDDAIACKVAKAVASARNCVVACSCGVHVDNATPETLQQIQDCVPALIDGALTLLASNEPDNQAS